MRDIGVDVPRVLTYMVNNPSGYDSIMARVAVPEAVAPPLR